MAETERVRMDLTKWRAFAAESAGRDVRCTVSDFRESSTGAITFDVDVIRTGPSHLEHERICTECSKPFLALSAKATACSDTCRVRRHRRLAREAKK